MPPDHASREPGSPAAGVNGGVWLKAIVIIAAVTVAYSASLNAPFLFDDLGAVVNNPTIRHLASLAVLDSPADGSTTTGRPMVNVSYAFNYALSGDKVWSYHALNVALHVSAALLLFGVVRRTVLLMGPAATGASPAARVARSISAGRTATPATTTAFLTALLWALHPLQTESVICVAQRTEVLCGFFYLAVLYGFGRGVEKPAAWPWLVGSWLACLLGMATKEVMVTAPLLVLLYDRTFVARSFTAALRRRGRFYAALAGTWLLLAFLVLQGAGARGASAGFGLGITGWAYLLKQAEALVLYLKLACWPHPLVLDYGTAVAQSLADAWWQAALVLVLVGVTIWSLVRRPVLGFVGAGFFLILAPSSSVVPLVTQTVAEHRMYLPLAFLIAALVAGGSRIPGRAAVLATVALALGGLTIARNHDYRSALAIWTDTVGKAPGNARAHNNLALVLQQQGDAGAANRHYARAVALQPDYVSGRYNWGVALLEQGRPAEAIAQLEAAVRLAPEHADAHMNLGNALMKARRPAEARGHYEAALRLSPAADAHYNLGIALSELGESAAAVSQFENALRLDPSAAEAHYQLGRIAEHDGRVADAERHHTDALRGGSGHAGAHARLGLLLARAGRLAAAEQHFREAIRLRPDDADAHANLGNVLLLQSRPRDAIAAYEESLRLRPGDARTRENIQIARESLTGNR